MLETKTLTLSINLEADEFWAILRVLNEEGWVPAAMRSEMEFLRLAGLDDRESIRVGADVGHRVGQALMGDLFFRSDGVYYAIANRGARTYTDARGRRFVVAEPAERKLEIGLIGEKNADSSARLGQFAEAWTSAMRATLDGRKTRHMNFDWAALEPGRSRLLDLQRSGAEGPDVHFETATLANEEVAAADILALELPREVLQELSQAGFGRERDILNRRAKKAEEVRSTLEVLKKSGLVRTEHLLQCKKFATPLARLTDPTQLSEGKVGKLTCASCGAEFSEETLVEGYSVSELGRKLTRHSHWMTVSVTKRLADLGVPLESILWNFAESGEEVDVVVEFVGQLWIIELKAREFGAGDAHPFNYRRVRYRAQKAMVLTTDKVSADAKKVFRELQERSESQADMGIVLAEGLAKAEEILKQQVGAAALRGAAQRLRGLADALGYDVSLLLGKKFQADQATSAAAD